MKDEMDNYKGGYFASAHYDERLKLRIAEWELQSAGVAYPPRVTPIEPLWSPAQGFYKNG